MSLSEFVKENGVHVEYSQSGLATVYDYNCPALSRLADYWVLSCNGSVTVLRPKT